MTRVFSVAPQSMLQWTPFLKSLTQVEGGRNGKSRKAAPVRLWGKLNNVRRNLKVVYRLEWRRSDDTNTVRRYGCCEIYRAWMA